MNRVGLRGLGTAEFCRNLRPGLSEEAGSWPPHLRSRGENLVQLTLPCPALPPPQLRAMLLRAGPTSFLPHPSLLPC